MLDRFFEKTPQGGLQKGESIKKFFHPSPLKYWFWYLIGVVLLVAIIGIPILLVVELYRRGHKYFITNKRIISQFTFLSRDINEVSWDLVTRVSISQSLLSRILHIGTVNVETASGEIIEFDGIGSPKNVKNTVMTNKQKYKDKAQKVEIVGKEGGKKYCPDCGAEITEGTNFCPECGHKIENEE